MNKIFFFYLFFIIILLSSCCSYRIKDDELNKIKSNPHGYIEFVFRDQDEDCLNSMKHKIWESTIIINNIEYVSNYEFKGGTKYLVPVYIGTVTIDYKLNYVSQYYGQVCRDKLDKDNEYRTGEYVIYKTGNARWIARHVSKKRITIFLKQDEKMILVIKNIKDKKYGVGSISSGACTIPSPELFQEVCFEIENFDNTKN